MRFVPGPRALVLAGILAASAGCGNSSTTGATGTAALISIVVTPNPIVSTIYSTFGPVYAANWTTNIVESAGVGGTVTFVKASIFDPLTGTLLAVSNYDDKDLLVFLGKSHIDPKGTLSVPQQATFTPSAGKAAVVTVDVQFKDDGGLVQERSLLVKIE